MGLFFLLLLMFLGFVIGVRFAATTDEEQAIIDAIKNSNYNYYVSAKGDLTKKKKVLDKKI